MERSSDIEHCDIDVGDGLTLHVAMSGSGPPLVLLHGFTGSGEIWAPLRAGFSAAHTVIAVDLPGHGRSSAPADPQRYTLTRFADDLAHVLDALAVERTALLGYSMGGRAALRFALSHRDRLAALILESTSPGISDDALRSERLASDNSLADSIERDGIERFVERWEQLPLWSSQSNLSDDGRAKLHAQRLENDPAGLANSLRGAGAAVELPVLDRLAEIHAPTFLIAGALDSKYVELGRLIQKSLPDARMAIVPGAGHAGHFERPDAFATAMSEFLRNIGWG